MSNYRHGHKRGTGTRTYSTWCAMRTRCTSPKHPQYEDYGGRGIAVCERWRKFENFLADMGERPPRMSIDRLDNDVDYEPGNCRWATRKEQMRNKRKNRIVVIDGRSMCLAEAIELRGISQQTFETRVYSRRWPVERALNTPVRVYRRKPIEGEDE